MFGKKLLIAFGLAVLGASAGSAAPIYIVVDPSLSNAEVYDITGNYTWRKPLRFGPFSTRGGFSSSRDEQVNWGWGDSYFEVSGRTEKTRKRYVFVGDQGEEWKVECRSNTPVLHKETLKASWTIPVGQTQIACAMRNAAGEVHVLALATPALDIRGVVEFGGDPIEISSLHEILDKKGTPRRLPLPLGFELRQGDHVVGSVDPGGRRVYLAQNLAPELRTQVALTSTVLLFFGKD
ncbi:MAG TPA: hypothetical protein VGS22_11860 [Thermoanaerobaculia bacterium]|nr:hypothetical protein [Thermoanaerobaculia bacterium]